MNSFAERLREERQRLGLNQTDFAASGGVKRDAQQNYESGSRRPDSSYLEAIAALGVDVAYLLKGQRNASELSADEEVLIAGYRSLDAQGRAGVLGMIGGMTQVPAVPKAAKTTTVHQNFEGANVGQHVTGDVTAPFSINMGGAGRKKKRES
ncbi:XRE family transcriptional regulator [Burkholderia stagnalis]|uniref:helix-turn-helix domain-containing protein n=1 Tax=Burkholderia stagnalis TaxID=1503054 RepID=UPI00075FCEA4|nr:helix-turn-helix transcriptional regulator [Burkholderia stagnalis]KWI64102.1 XRE family transcriptional regulator [Burkholderia stagnalis]KWN16705.1 XRE family transcriptional regulator [Burkholderia stagnalis]KWN37917.1 XRE family transcriptional regulator [Burkholderia stagnalis]